MKLYQHNTKKMQLIKVDGTKPKTFWFGLNSEFLSSTHSKAHEAIAKACLFQFL